MAGDNTDNQVTSKIGEEMVKRDENGRIVGGVLNPNGRPKKEHSLTDAMKQTFRDRPEILQALIQKALKMALDGDTQALKMVWNYMDGMPTQTNVLEGGENGPVIVKIVEDKPLPEE